MRGDERIRTAVRHFCTSESNDTSESYVGLQGHWVYFLQEWANENGPVKIGYSRDPERRVRHINRTLKAPCLTIIGAFPGTREDEKALHRRFRRYRLLGEWFRPAPEVLRAAALARALHFEAAS